MSKTLYYMRAEHFSLKNPLMLGARAFQRKMFLKLFMIFKGLNMDKGVNDVLLFNN